MGTQLRSWLGYIVLIIVGLLVVVLVIRALVVNGTGFDTTTIVTVSNATTTTPTTVTAMKQYQQGKTLWDWLQLLIIPSVLAAGALWFNAQQSKASNAENTDNQLATALQGYLDKMSELLLDKNKPLRKSGEDDEERKIARARTLTVLRGIDPARKGSVLQFLKESDLISKDGPVVKLAGADLKEAKLKGADLKGTCLEGADLKGAVLRAYQERNGQFPPPGQITKFENRNFIIIKADLEGAILRKAILRDAHLEGAILRDAHLEEAYLENAYLNRADLHEVHLNGADLSGANLSGADLSGADLSGVRNLTQQQLDQVDSCKGVTLPQGLTGPQNH